MKNWNVIVTVLPGPGRERRLLNELKRLGEFGPCEFKDVCLGRVDDANALLAAIHQADEDAEEWVADVGRVIPIERKFHFTPDTLTAQLQEAVAPFLDRMPGGTFFFRLERRGMLGQIMSQEIERAVAEHLYALAERQGKTLHTDFDYPDYIIVGETVGNECGVTLLTREMRERFPFVQAR